MAGRTPARCKLFSLSMGGEGDIVIVDLDGVNTRRLKTAKKKPPPGGLLVTA